MAVKNWAKAMIWEITPYGADGIYGPVPTATEQEKTMKELLGVNGIWGWGTKAYSNVSNPCVGPSLYTPCSSHGRNYHNWNWDVTDPDDTPDYEAMAEGEGTEAQWWLNWLIHFMSSVIYQKRDTEYSAWVASGLEVEASIQVRLLKLRSLFKFTSFLGMKAYSVILSKTDTTMALLLLATLDLLALT